MYTEEQNEVNAEVNKVKKEEKKGRVTIILKNSIINELKRRGDRKNTTMSGYIISLITKDFEKILF